jgi:hypothetical protein
MRKKEIIINLMHLQDKAGVAQPGKAQAWNI